MTVANIQSERNQVVIDRHLQTLRERAERKARLGIEAVLRAEVDKAVAEADDTPERNPLASRWSEHEMDWTWAFIARPEFVR